MLTRFLTLGNFMVVSSSLRRVPFWHLLESEFHSESYTPHVKETLTIVARRLGFKSLSLLFESYATHIANAISLLNLDFTRLSWDLLGYANVKSFMDATFPIVCPMLALRSDSSDPELLIKQPFFANYLRTTHQTIEQALARVFPAIVGWKAVFYLEDTNASQEQVLAEEFDAHLGEMMEKWARRCLVDGAGEDDAVAYIQKSLDRIAFNILRLLQDVDYSSGGPLAKAAQTVSLAPQHAEVFKALNSYRKHSPFVMHPPNPPSVPALTIVKCLKWLAGFAKRRTTFKPSTSGMTYNVIRLLLAETVRTPLANDQLQMFSALSLHISFHFAEIKDLAFLRLLMHGAVILLPEYDLAPCAQSLLNWCMNTYARLSEGSDARAGLSSFPDILSQIAHVAGHYASHPTDQKSRDMGLKLIEWLESKTSEYSAHETLRHQILSSVVTWPPNLRRTVEEFEVELQDYENLTHIFKDPTISINKFRITQRLRDHATFDKSALKVFATDEFWRLKSCVPAMNDLHDDDVAAFAELLSLRAGKIDMMPDSLSENRSLALRYSRLTPKGLITPTTSQYIILLLYEMLYSYTMVMSDLAYRTLRYMFSAGCSIPDVSKNPLTLRELKLLASYLVPTPTPKTASLEDLANSPKYNNSRTNFKVWISLATVLFSGVLSTSQSFFSHLSTLLEHDVAFAQELFPLLVHELLILPSESNSTPRLHLSRYFSSLLSFPDTENKIKKTIIDTVLHLRHFPPSPTLSPNSLECNYWLDVDYLLLSNSATRCGAFTTALLFLELAADGPEKHKVEETSEDILFTIYSHIEEPDGFYGIKSQDPHAFLLRRLHHEKRWEKALQFHNAGWTNHNDAMTQALHNLGWNDLAMKAISKDQRGNSSVEASSEMWYELGWRVGHWDLPAVTPENQPSATIYIALQSMHQERDGHRLAAKLRQLSRMELIRLSATGNEDMEALRSSVRRLLSLREIQRWKSADDLQDLEDGLRVEAQRTADFE